MKICLKNIGMLDEANFEVGELTLICGENNTGKTYATYSLYGYLDYMRKIRDNVLFRAKINLIEEKGEVAENTEIKLTYLQIKDRLSKYMAKRGDTYSKHKIIEVMAGKREDFFNTEIQVDIDISLEQVKSATKQYLEGNINPLYKKRIQHTLYNDGVGFSSNHRNEIREYFEVFFSSLLHVILRRNFILSVERTGASIFQEELDFTKIVKLEVAKKLLKNEDISFFETQRALDEKIQLYPQPVRDNIATIRNAKVISKQESIFKKDKEKYKAIFDVLGKIVGGKYKATESGILFQPKSSKKAYNIEIASSSVRSLLMLHYYIFHIAEPNDILMIDEPELNLHPKNQIFIARLLALLVNAGIKVFITTHSDYIVRELSNCIMLHNLKSEQFEKLKMLGYGKEYGLEYTKIKAYLATTIKGKNTLKEAQITQEQGIFIETFDEPIDSQNENQGLIFEAVLKANKINGGAKNDK